MADSRYTVGLLAASCLLLALGIVLTWLEISEYGQEVPSRSAVTPGVVPAEPEATITEEGAEAPVEGGGELPVEGGGEAEDLPIEGGAEPEVDEFF